MRLNKTAAAVALLAATFLSGAALAEDVNLMDGVTPRAGDNPMVEAGKYKKDCGWVIGMSHFGVNANTWGKDERAWEMWRRVCESHGTSPMRTAAE